MVTSLWEDIPSKSHAERDRKAHGNTDPFLPVGAQGALGVHTHQQLLLLSPIAMQNGKTATRKPSCNHKEKGDVPPHQSKCSHLWTRQKRRVGGTIHAQAVSLSSGSNPSPKAMSSPWGRAPCTAPTPGKVQTELYCRFPAQLRAHISPCATSHTCPTLQGCRVMPTHFPTPLPSPPVLHQSNGFTLVSLSPRQYRRVPA